MIKYLLLVSVLFSLQSCKTNTTAEEQQTNKQMIDVNGLVAGCPDGGSCSWEMKQNTSFSLAVDGTGATYPVYTNGKGTVAVYTFEQKGPEGTADGDYKEQVLFNVPSFKGTKVFKDSELAEVNLLFNKQCFCRGQAGYYPITEGTLQLSTKEDGTLGVVLHYTLDKTSHKIPSIVR